MHSSTESDFEYHLLHTRLDDPRLTDLLVRTFYGYAQTIVDLFIKDPEARPAALTAVFSRIDKRLDKHLIGTSFKVWFTREAIQATRQNPHFNNRPRLTWPQMTGPPDSPASKRVEKTIPGLHQAPLPFKHFLPLALRGPLSFSIVELAEYLKTSEEDALHRLYRSTDALFKQRYPDWKQIPQEKTARHVHQWARGAAHLKTFLPPDTQMAVREHLLSCPRCQAYSDFVQSLDQPLATLSEQQKTPDEATIARLVMAMRSTPRDTFQRQPRRLRIWEAVWVMIAIGFILGSGWLVNQINPLVEVRPTSPPSANNQASPPLNDPPQQVLTTGLSTNNEATILEPENSWDPHISPGGSHLVFASSIRRLVDEDTNEVNDIFVYNFADKQLTRVSVTSAGQQANNASYESAISANGRLVVFSSWASNLVEGDALTCTFWSGTGSSCPDIFLHDLVTGETRLISKTPEGLPGDNFSLAPEISADGRTIIFWSAASDLVAGDKANCPTVGNPQACLDIFIYSLPTGQMERIPIGRPIGDLFSGTLELNITADGRFILIPLEQRDQLAQEIGMEQAYEVVLFDRENGTIEPINLAPDGTPGDDSSFSASISDDARWVAFSSRASNLVPNDTHGSIDVFIRDRQDGSVERISSSFNGGEADGPSGALGDTNEGWWFGDSLRISGDGNWVIFASQASDILSSQLDYYCGFAPDCTSNLFLYDRVSKQTIQVNVSNVDFYPFASLSRDGMYAAFMAHSINCNPSDFCTDIYIFNRESGIVAQLGSYGILTEKKIPITTSPLENRRTYRLHQSWTTSVAFSPSSEILAAGGRDGTLTLWSLRDEDRLESLDGQTMAFSPDGSLLAAGSNDGKIYLWRMPQGQLSGVLTNEQRARGLAFSPDGKFIAVGSSLRVRLWSLEDRTVAQDFTFPGTVVQDVAISPDGEFLAAALDDNTTRLISLVQPGYTLSLGGHTEKVTAVEFSTDGSMLATAGNDKQANLWDLKLSPDGRLSVTRRLTFLHGDWVSSLAFSPDNRMLATGSFDNTVAIWDLREAVLVDIPFQQNQNQVLSLAWSPDGKILAAGTVRGEVHIWKDLDFE